MHVYRTLVSVFVMVDRNEGWPLPNNDRDDRGRGVGSTQTKTADRALRVHPIVT
jgi:hypothetical protein